MGKYRIKLPEGVPSVYIGQDCIVELEPIDEPIMSCPFCGYVCKDFDDSCESCTKKVEPKEQSLEEKLRIFMCKQYCSKTADEVSEHRIAQIAKEHFQEHPEEIIDNMWIELAKKCNFNTEGMVSLDKVLKVFDEAVGDQKIFDTVGLVSKLRKALEQLKESK